MKLLENYLYFILFSKIEILKKIYNIISTILLVIAQNHLLMSFWNKIAATMVYIKNRYSGKKSKTFFEG